jgi:hypothetical protein
LKTSSRSASASAVEPYPKSWKFLHFIDYSSSANILNPES